MGGETKRPGGQPTLAPEDRKAIRRRLRELRATLGLTQEQFADAAGHDADGEPLLPVSTVTGWMRNVDVGPVPTAPAHWLALARAFNVSPTWLLTGRGGQFMGGGDVSPEGVRAEVVARLKRSGALRAADVDAYVAPADEMMRVLVRLNRERVKLAVALNRGRTTPIKPAQLAAALPESSTTGGMASTLDSILDDL